MHTKLTGPNNLIEDCVLKVVSSFMAIRESQSIFDHSTELCAAAKSYFKRGSPSGSIAADYYKDHTIAGIKKIKPIKNFERYLKPLPSSKDSFLMELQRQFAEQQAEFMNKQNEIMNVCDQKHQDCLNKVQSISIISFESVLGIDSQSNIQQNSNEHDSNDSTDPNDSTAPIDQSDSNDNDPSAPYGSEYIPPFTTIDSKVNLIEIEKYVKDSPIVPESHSLDIDDIFATIVKQLETFKNRLTFWCDGTTVIDGIPEAIDFDRLHVKTMFKYVDFSITLIVDGEVVIHEPVSTDSDQDSIPKITEAQKKRLSEIAAAAAKCVRARKENRFADEDECENASTEADSTSSADVLGSDLFNLIQASMNTELAKADKSRQNDSEESSNDESEQFVPGRKTHRKRAYIEGESDMELEDSDTDDQEFNSNDDESADETDNNDENDNNDDNESADETDSNVTSVSTAINETGNVDSNETNNNETANVDSEPSVPDHGSFSFTNQLSNESSTTSGSFSCTDRTLAELENKPEPSSTESNRPFRLIFHTEQNTQPQTSYIILQKRSETNTDTVTSPEVTCQPTETQTESSPESNFKMEHSYLEREHHIHEINRRAQVPMFSYTEAEVCDRVEAAIKEFRETEVEKLLKIAIDKAQADANRYIETQLRNSKETEECLQDALFENAESRRCLQTTSDTELLLETQLMKLEMRLQETIIECKKEKEAAEKLFQNELKTVDERHQTELSDTGKQAQSALTAAERMFQDKLSKTDKRVQEAVNQAKKEAQVALNEAGKEKSALEQALNEAGKEKTSIKQALNEANQRAEELEKAKAALVEATERVQELEKATENGNRVQEALVEATERVQELEKATENGNRVQEALDEANERIQELEKATENGNRVQEALDKANQRVQELEKATENGNRVQEALDDATERVQELEKATEDKLRAFNEAEKLLKADLETTEKRAQELNAAKEQLQAQLEKVNERAQIESNNAEKRVQSAVSAAEKLFQNKLIKADELLQEAVDKANKREAKLKNVNERLQDQLKNVSERAQTEKDIKERIQAAVDEVNGRARFSIDELKTQHQNELKEAEKRAHTELENVNEANKAAVDEAKKQLKKVTDANKAAVDEAKKQQDELKKVTDANKLLQTAVDETKKAAVDELKKVTDANKAAVDEAKKQQEQLKKVTEANNLLQAAVDEAKKAAVDEAKKQQDELKRITDANKAAVDEAKNELKKVTEANKLVETELGKATESNKYLEDKLKTVTDAKERAQAELKVLKERGQAELKDANEAADSRLQAAVDEAKNELKTVTEAKKLVETELERAVETSKRLQNELKVLKERSETELKDANEAAEKRLQNARKQAQVQLKKAENQAKSELTKAQQRFETDLAAANESKKKALTVANKAKQRVQTELKNVKKELNESKQSAQSKLDKTINANKRAQAKLDETNKQLQDQLKKADESNKRVQADLDKCKQQADTQKHTLDATEAKLKEVTDAQKSTQEALKEITIAKSRVQDALNELKAAQSEPAYTFKLEQTTAVAFSTESVTNSFILQTSLDDDDKTEEEVESDSEPDEFSFWDMDLRKLDKKKNKKDELFPCVSYSLPYNYWLVPPGAQVLAYDREIATTRHKVHVNHYCDHKPQIKNVVIKRTTNKTCRHRQCICPDCKCNCSRWYDPNFKYNLRDINSSKWRVYNQFNCKYQNYLRLNQNMQYGDFDNIGNKTVASWPANLQQICIEQRICGYYLNDLETSFAVSKILGEIWSRVDLTKDGKNDKIYAIKFLKECFTNDRTERIFFGATSARRTINDLLIHLNSPEAYFKVLFQFIDEFSLFHLAVLACCFTRKMYFYLEEVGVQIKVDCGKLGPVQYCADENGSLLYKDVYKQVTNPLTDKNVAMMNGMTELAVQKSQIRYSQYLNLTEKDVDEQLLRYSIYKPNYGHTCVNVSFSRLNAAHHPQARHDTECEKILTDVIYNLDGMSTDLFNEVTGYINECLGEKDDHVKFLETLKTLQNVTTDCSRNPHDFLNCNTLEFAYADSVEDYGFGYKEFGILECLPALSKNLKHFAANAAYLDFLDTYCRYAEPIKEMVDDLCKKDLKTQAKYRLNAFVYILKLQFARVLRIRDHNMVDSFQLANVLEKLICDWDAHYDNCKRATEAYSGHWAERIFGMVNEYADMLSLKKTLAKFDARVKDAKLLLSDTFKSGTVEGYTVQFTPVQQIPILRAVIHQANIGTIYVPCHWDLYYWNIVENLQHLSYQCKIGFTQLKSAKYLHIGTKGDVHINDSMLGPNSPILVKDSKQLCMSPKSHKILYQDPETKFGIHTATII